MPITLAQVLSNSGVGGGSLPTPTSDNDFLIGDTGVFGVKSLAQAQAILGIAPTDTPTFAGLTSTGDVSVSVNGSTTSDPRILGLSDLSGSEAGLMQFGDQYNSFGTTNGGDLMINAYHSIVARGHHSSLNDVPFLTLSDSNIHVYNASNVPGIRLRNNINGSQDVILDHKSADLNTTYTELTGSGHLRVSLGSSSDVAVGFVGDTNTGIFSGGADEFSLTAGGNDILEVKNNGGTSQLGFYGTTPANQPVVALGSSTDDLISALAGLGLIATS